MRIIVVLTVLWLAVSATAFGDAPSDKKDGNEMEPQVTSEEVPYLGVQIIGQNKVGVKVLRVAKDSPAEKAGIVSDDVILEFGDRTFLEEDIDLSSFPSVTAPMPTGCPLRILVLRDNKTFETTVTLERLKPDEMEAKFPPDREQAYENFQEANRFIKRDDYRSAIYPLIKAIAFHPEDPFYYTVLGHAYYQTGNAEAAVEEFRKSIQIEPSYYPYYWLGVIYSEHQQYEEAIPYLEQAVSLRTAQIKDSHAFELLGYAYFEKRYIQEALQTYKRAYNIDQRSPLTLYMLGGCYDLLNKKSQALYFYKKYLKSNYDDHSMNQTARKRVRMLEKK